VLVFGSMLPAQGVTEKPIIRFIHQLNRSAPNYVLHEMKVTKGDRFYAILKPPAELKRVDQFETEVSWAQGYDKINFVRVSPQSASIAMYLGEIQMTLSARPDASGRGAVTATVRDDFQSAAKELHRLYPGFEGEVTKVPMLRSPVPAAAPPARVSP